MKLKKPLTISLVHVIAYLNSDVELKESSCLQRAKKEVLLMISYTEVCKKVVRIYISTHLPLWVLPHNGLM